MPRTYSSVAITAGAGTAIDTVQTSLDADQRQIVVLGDPDTDTQLLAIDASGRAQVATFPLPSTVGTSSAVAASATVVTLLVSNGNRLGYTVFNDSTSALYLLNGSGASLTAYSLQVPANGYYECPIIAGRGYAGIVTGIWTSAIGNARLVEHT